MRDADHTLPSSAEVKKELSYTSTHPVGPPGPVTGFPLVDFCSSSLKNASGNNFASACRGVPHGTNGLSIASRRFVIQYNCLSHLDIASVH